MNSRLVLYRMRGPMEAERQWLTVNSLAALAALRPDAYDVRDFPTEGLPMALHERSAIVTRVDGDHIEHASWALAQPGIRQSIAAGIPVVFDDSTELGISGRDSWQSLRRAVAAADLPPARLLWLGQNERGPQDCAECFAGETRHYVKAMVFHYWLHRTRIGVTAPPVRPDRHLREKRFLSLNKKLRSHRAAIVGWLADEGLLARGLVSLSPQPWKAQQFRWESVEAFAADADVTLPGFGARIASARQFLEEGLVVGDGRATPRDVPWDLHARTGFSLVSETEMKGRQALRFTEKTLKALAAWHPVIVAGNFGVLKLLRDYGFRTFSPWIDESYDLIEAPAERLHAVMAEARRLIEMPEEAFDRLLDDVEPVLEHNHRHFMEGLPAIMDRQHEAFQRAVADLASAR